MEIEELKEREVQVQLVNKSIMNAFGD